MIIHLFEYGSNKRLDEFVIDESISYATGDFFIRQQDFTNYKENMYIIRAVTHLMPITGIAQIAVHVERYDIDKVQAEVDKVKDIMNLLNGKGKYEQKATEEKSS